MNRQQEKPSTRLAEPDAALSSYLDVLLQEISEIPVEAPVAETKVATKIADITEQTLTETVSAAHVSEEVTAGPVTGVVSQTVEVTQTVNEPIIPSWAEMPFQVLVFKVGGLNLGIPLTGLVSILEWRDEASVMPGQPDWNLGVLVNRGQKIVVVDTARLVMPERVSGRVPGERQSGGHVLVVGDGGYGLAVDGIAETIMLNAGGVRWRTAQGKRPWLAGTMVEQLSVLLDIDGMLGMISA
ncbi:MAG: chemotaxis protein CheW [gamma proteobacterium endosymbiont of Lamellibrachia anaximandri]|nr:chemotaxis protein CheW [gamma proteobacterium endosymbiont of Lamellibrachia anaximandri]MBL3617871.1 chemotaxis protein CheW [gamma proteobacterium endosymbiont of Lamellibrachia anaximandri]